MHLANSYYGHAQVLSRWAGFQRALPIWGFVQHGFNTGTGFSPDEPPRWVPAFVWNERNLRNARLANLRATAIGAPFAYLVAAQSTVEAGQGTIVYPFHGWEREPGTGGHDRYAQVIHEREGPGTTVCLYWLEYEDAAIRRVYEEHGFRTVCHGRRTSVDFLDRQLSELSAHKRVVTNAIGTVLWYGMALKREVELYGTPMALKGGDDARSLLRAYARIWPRVFEGRIYPDEGYELGSQELGLSFLRSPEELGEILGWVRARRWLGRGLAPIVHSLQNTKRRLQGW